MYTIKLVPDTQTTHLGTTEALNKLKSLEGDQPTNQRNHIHKYNIDLFIILLVLNKLMVFIHTRNVHYKALININHR